MPHFSAAAVSAADAEKTSLLGDVHLRARTSNVTLETAPASGKLRLSIMVPWQAVYLVEVAQQTTKLLIETDENIEVDDDLICFSPDSSLIALPLCENWAGDLAIYNRAGLLLALIELPAVFWKRASLAFTQGGLAAAVGLTFQIWDPLTAEVQGFGGPCMGVDLPYEVRAGDTDSSSDSESDSEDDHNGIVAANRSGSRLAFCAAGSFAVYVYDVSSFEVLAYVTPAQAVPPVPSNGELLWLAWSSAGWLMWHARKWASYRELARLHAFQQVAIGRHEEVLRVEVPGEQSVALSPDGAFVCSSDADGGRLLVHDTRSGQLLVDYGLEVGAEGQDGARLRCESFSWSRCGKRVLIRACLVRHDRSRTRSKLCVLKF